MGPTGDRILDAAFSCAEEGPDFTMADVARAAGLSRQGVYLHFPDRKTLLIALALRAREQHPTPKLDDAPSARAALTALIARFVEIYPKVWPVVRALDSETGDRTVAPDWRCLAERFRNESALAAQLSPATIAPDCRVLAERFRNEGALAAHLSSAAAADLLATLLSLAVWKELVLGCGWDSARYKSHIGFLAAGALTR